MEKMLHGIVPPVVTPFTADERLDVAGLKRLIEHMLGGGVHGLFILGSTGEGPALGEDVQRAMIAETCRIVKRRVPVLVGISSTSLRASLELAAFAADSGAEYVVAAPPCYYNPGAPELIDFFTELADRAPLPLLIYNMPSMTKVDIAPEVVIELAAHKNIVGYKDSSGSMVNLHEVIIGAPKDFAVFVGPEELLGDTVIFGADGGVCGGANVTPKLFVAMYDAARRGDIPKVRELQRAFYLHRKLYSVGHYQSSGIKGIKAALAMKGICDATMAAPFKRFNPPEQERIGQILKDIDESLAKML